MIPKNLLASSSVLLCLLCSQCNGFAQEKQKASALPDIVYTSHQYKFEGGSGIYLLSKGKSELLTPGFLHASMASWSPDGTKIVFHGRKKKSDPRMIFILDIGQNKFTQLTNKKRDSFNSTWSPDGKTIAFESLRVGEYSDQHIFLMNIDGRNKRRLSTKYSDGRGPSWSPKGHRIVFVVPSRNVAVADNVMIATLHDGNVKKIAAINGSCILPTWSPDGKRIAFASNRHSDPNNIANLQIFVMNSDGTDIRQTTNFKDQNIAPDWSSDGKRILFYSIKHIDSKKILHLPALLYHPAELYVINADGTGLKKLTGTKKNASFPKWRPPPKK